MSKIYMLEVDSCSECPGSCFLASTGWVCREVEPTLTVEKGLKEWRDIPNDLAEDSVPDWCPLDEVTTEHESSSDLREDVIQ